MQKYDYDVAFSALRIRKTRSRGNDTLWIKITVAVDGVNIGSSTWDGTGGRDKNDGYYDGLRNAGKHIIGVATGPITDLSVVKVSFLVANYGHTHNEDEYSKALATISSLAPLGGVWGYAITSLGALFSGILSADCDGPVAADAFQLTGKEIREALGNKPSYERANKTAYLGSDSAAGCGGNSNYDCIIQFTRHV